MEAWWSTCIPSHENNQRLPPQCGINIGFQHSEHRSMTHFLQPLPRYLDYCSVLILGVVVGLNGTWAEEQTDAQTECYTGRQNKIWRQTGRQVDRVTDRQADRQTDSHLHHGIQSLFLIHQLLGDLTLLQDLCITDSMAFGIQDQLQVINERHIIRSQTHIIRSQTLICLQQQFWNQ